MRQLCPTWTLQCDFLSDAMQCTTAHILLSFAASCCSTDRVSRLHDKLGHGRRGLECLRFFMKGRRVRLIVAASCMAFLLSGCALGQSASAPTPTPRSAAAVQKTATVRPTAGPRPTAIHVGKPYSAFLHMICRAFAAGNQGAITGSLMNYQYNTGLRYGVIGDGEGRSADPSLMGTWLAGSHVQCVSFSPGFNSHGAVLTRGWKQPAPWSLVELDLLNGHWKINDFTFGRRTAMLWAMQSAKPVLTYHG
jgi:hypothetical protein